MTPPQHSLLQHRVRLSHLLAGLCLLTPVIFTSSPSPVLAAYGNNYQRCAGRLLDTGLAPELVSTACAAALHPDELGGCVSKIYNDTDITAIDALSTCIRVRRPQELATCVVEISDKAEANLAPVILENCRRSLLPKRYSDCVVGLSRKIEILPVQAMDTCIDAADRPGPFDRSFIPQSQNIPSFPDIPIPPKNP